MVVMIGIAVGVLGFRTEYALYASLAFAALWAGSIIGLNKIRLYLFMFLGAELLIFMFKDVKAIANLLLLLVYFQRLIVAVIAASPIAKAPTGRLIASLNKLKVPRAATISLAVFFRFLPTVTAEYSAIRQAQRYRDIGVSVKTTALKIPQLFEYTIVPLLIRTTKIADELTASAEVRGMKLGGDYNPYYEVKMHAADWIKMLLALAAEAGIYYLDHICANMVLL